MTRKKGQMFTLICIPEGALVEFIRQSRSTGDCMVKFVDDVLGPHGTGYKSGDIIQVKPHELRRLGKETA